MRNWLKPEGVGASRIGIALGFLLLASCNDGAGREAAREDTLDPSVAHAQATEYAGAGDPERAVDILLPALREHPDDPDLHFRLGYILRYAGLFDESIESYEAGLAADDSPQRQVSGEGQIAKSLIYMGRYDDALELQEGLRDHLEELGERPDEKMLFYEGVIHMYRGDASRAIELFDEAEDTDPESLWTEFGRAYRDALNGDTASLRERAAELRSRDVADGERHYRLVHLHSLADEPDEALARLESALVAGFFAYPYVEEDPLLSDQVRKHPDFESVLGPLRARHEAFDARIERADAH